MNLIEEVKKQLEARLRSNTIAVDKLWAIRKEVEALTKLSGHLEVWHDGFTYYAADGGGFSKSVIRCAVEGSTTKLTYISRDGEEEEIDVTYEPIENIVAGLAYAISFRLSQRGIYQI